MMAHYRTERDGVAVGRFQPLHIGHMEYLKKARECCRRLIIGITNPNVNHLLDTKEDLARSADANNPFTYFERMSMIEAACTALGWRGADYAVVPAPITEPGDLPQFLPSPRMAVVFVTIYDAWGEEKKRRFEQLGYNVRVLWRRTVAERVTSGTAVRRLIRSDDSTWRELVPRGVDAVVRRHLEHHDRL